MTDKASTAPIAVIGAGIVGTATAIWLQRQGKQVLLIDRDGPASATSHGNAGVLAACSVVPVTVPGLWTKAPGMLLNRDQPLYLRWPYLPRLTPWLMRYMSHCKPREVRRIAQALHPLIADTLCQHQQLAAGTAAERWLSPCAYLFAYRDQAHYESDAFSWSLREELGYEKELLNAEQFKQRDPVFGEHCGYVVRVPDHGRVADPGQYTKDLADAVLSNGGRFLQATVDDLSFQDGAVNAIYAGGQRLPVSSVVLATGAWSGPLAARLGISVPLESERGYHIDLWGANLRPQEPTLIAELKLVATPMHDRLRLAGAVEFGGLQAGPSPSPKAMLQRAVRRVLPGLTWRQADEWMGHRPAPADSIPVIGPSPDVKGAWMAFGHHHIGLTAAAKTGRLLAQMMTGQAPDIDMSPYSPSRFR